jgi:hypothetical protein
VAIIVCVGGLGLHAARDWHRHGELGAGFFHLHFHVGDHEHDHHGHDHPAHDDHDHDTPTDRPGKRSAVLTVAHAIQNVASAAPTVASPESTPDRTPIESVDLPRPTKPSVFANPRAPPV